MTVRNAVDAALEESQATELEQELARALAEQIDGGQGAAAAVKELRSLMGEVVERKPEADVLDELTKRRAARRAI